MAERTRTADDAPRREDESRASLDRLATGGLLAGGMALFGSGTPVSKLVTEDFPPFLASGVRTALGALVLLPVMVVLRRRRGCDRLLIPRLGRRDALLLAGIALFGMFAFSLLMLYGMREVTGAVGSVVMAGTPAVTALGAVVFLRERLDRWRSIGIALAVAGVVTVNLGGGVEDGGAGRLWLGTLLVFGGVCGEAAYTLLGKRLTADLTPVEVTALASGLGALLFLPPALLQAPGADWGAVGAGAWAALAWWGAGTLALGSAVWYAGLRRSPGSTAAAFMGVMPVSALVLSYLLLDEPFRWIHAGGMAAVLAGIVAVNRSGG